MHARLPLFSLLAVEHRFMANNEQNVQSEESHHLQEQIRNVQRQLQDLDAQKTILLSLLEKLEKRCHTQVSTCPTVVHNVQPRTPASAIRGDDIALFASLFRGREDVFPKRWEGRDGKCGYTPACQNEWVRGVCDKPRTKCSECLHRKFVAVTEEVLHRHLAGQMTIGVYPLLKDETCHFLALDFDKKEWMHDVSAFASTCQKRDLTCAVERSRSGTGVLSAPSAFGKTVVGARLIAERQVNTLVLVHRKQLLDQWRASLSAFLGMDEQSVGQIAGGKNRPTGLIDVAMLQSLQRKGVVADIVADYGQVIVDECHHVSAFTFEQVLRQAKAKYVLGLTATPTRKDGHHPIVFMQCGPIRYALSDQQMARSRRFEHKVIVRETGTLLGVPEQQARIHDVYWAILRDARRTDLIIADVREAVRAGRCPVILTERREYLEMLSQRLDDLAALRFVLHGGMGEKQRRETVRKLFEIPDGQPRALLATGKYLGEGFDDARLDTLFLTMPISWRGILQQYAGRLHRAHHAKKEVVIYDYVDLQIPMAARMFERRKKGYAAIGYTVADALQPGLDLTNKNGESR